MIRAETGLVSLVVDELADPFFARVLRLPLADLVVIDRILEYALRTYLAHLRPDDQRRARDELEHLRSQKRARVRRAMEAAYGLKRPEEGDLDAAYKKDPNGPLKQFDLSNKGALDDFVDRAKINNTLGAVAAKKARDEAEVKRQKQVEIAKAAEAKNK